MSYRTPPDPNRSRPGATPPPGAEPPHGDDGLEGLLGAAAAHGGARCVPLCPICRTADALRAGAPPELREQWHVLQREALLTLKAAIDHYLERLDEPAEREPAVEDIPIA